MSALDHPCRGSCPCADPTLDAPLQREHPAGEASGAVVMVLEAGARWPSRFEAHREGHADVAVVVQQPEEGREGLQRRVGARVAELRAGGRCARTAVLAAHPSGDARSDVARALLARSLLGALCPECGVLWLVTSSGESGLHRHLRGLAQALREGSYGSPIDVCVDVEVQSPCGPVLRDAVWRGGLRVVT